ncbi:MAG TPA: hypothetical protein VN625_10335 [Desulfuromonadaceae bacterium]|nr:hypothetical protein [Desulfuromonadaceae bacterium]
MRKETRSELAIVTYWALFIIGPIIAILLKTPPSRAGAAIGLVLIWLIIVPQGADIWLRLWCAQDRKESKPRPAPRIQPRRRHREFPEFDRPQRSRKRS